MYKWATLNFFQMLRGERSRKQKAALGSWGCLMLMYGQRGEVGAVGIKRRQLNKCPFPGRAAHSGQLRRQGTGMGGRSLGALGCSVALRVWCGQDWHWLLQYPCQSPPTLCAWDWNCVPSNKAAMWQAAAGAQHYLTVPREPSLCRHWNNAPAVSSGWPPPTKLARLWGRYWKL